jgi:hypothetical protein
MAFNLRRQSQVRLEGADRAGARAFLKAIHR